MKGSKGTLIRSKKKSLKERQSFGKESEVADDFSQANKDVVLLNEQKSTESKFEKKKKKLKSLKRRRREEENKMDDNNENQQQDEDERIISGIHSDQPSEHIIVKAKEQNGIEETNVIKKIKSRKVKKGKRKSRDLLISGKISTLEENTEDSERVEKISSEDEDCSRGMKKWLSNYQEKRPDLKILQQRIDDIMTAHEEQQEQEKKEREALAAEGGWTVVVHQKGRKKTTDTESGITVGSVAQAAVLDSMTKKKNKEIALNFYRFQKKEAQRNEVMMLQSRFEQDKKRIQELRAARKFRPY